MKRLIISAISAFVTFAPLGAESIRATLPQGGKLALPDNYIRKNTLLEASIRTGNFGAIRLGRGDCDLYTFNYAYNWVDVTADSVKVVELYGNGENVSGSWAHGLNLRGRVDISIDYVSDRADLVIKCSGKTFSTDIKWWGGGAPIIINNGTEPIQATLSFTPRDASEAVWIYGDSYFNWTYNERWPYYVAKEGHLSWMADHLPGGASRRMFDAFMNDLRYGTPKIAVWMLGMNDSRDDNGLSPHWMECAQKFLDVCKEKGIEPVLATIPSVPERNHRLKTKWIRESGIRYIDMASAVMRNENDSQWRPGMLYKDNVHPTASGAEAIAKAVLRDLPEITGHCADAKKRPRPTPHQLAWQDMEYVMFCHFGPNTFTGLEWGNGDENPEIFNPDSLDCEQWVRTAIDAGMKGIILTAKHHDGFCLWPSAYSKHTVAQSKWRDGKGDVLKELRAACDKYDFPMGVYISPWDRNHPLYGTEDYNQYFAQTVAEVHQAYGPMFEQWFDGANGGKKIPDYDWPLFNSTVYRYSPNAVIFSDVGPGCRWVGNENGYVGETNWNMLTVDGYCPGYEGSPSERVLNTGLQYGKTWIPAECDVPLRDGWFDSRANDGTQKSVEALMGIWMGSVGRGGNLLLNVAPDHTGRIPQADSLRLMEFKAARDDFFAEPVASVKGLKTLELSSPAKCIVIEEDLHKGQCVKAFVVEMLFGGMWTEVARGTTIGHKRILLFDSPVESPKMRVRILDSFDKPKISKITIY